MVTIKGDGAAWAACCAGSAGSGRRAGLFAAQVFTEINDARSARTNIFTELLHSAEAGFKGQDD
jgi:hypothetical protein